MFISCFFFQKNVDNELLEKIKTFRNGRFNPIRVIQNRNVFLVEDKKDNFNKKIIKITELDKDFEKKLNEINLLKQFNNQYSMKYFDYTKVDSYCYLFCKYYDVSNINMTIYFYIQILNYVLSK